MTVLLIREMYLRAEAYVAVLDLPRPNEVQTNYDAVESLRSCRQNNSAQFASGLQPSHTEVNPLLFAQDSLFSA